MDEMWEYYNERWIILEDDLKRSQLLAVFQAFCREYCDLLGRAVLQYVDLRTRSALAVTKRKSIDWTEIMNDAFKLTDHFASWEYQSPWNGAFVYRQIRGSRHDEQPKTNDGAIDFQRIKTSWFEESGKLTTEELSREFLKQVKSGHWIDYATARAMNQLQVNLDLNPPDKKAPSMQRQDRIRAEIACIKRDRTEVSANEIEQICRLLDNNKPKSVPLPLRWRNLGPRNWREMWGSKDFRPRLKTFISRIKPAAPEKE